MPQAFAARGDQMMEEKMDDWWDCSGPRGGRYVPGAHACQTRARRAILGVDCGGPQETRSQVWEVLVTTRVPWAAKTTGISRIQDQIGLQAMAVLTANGLPGANP